MPREKTYKFQNTMPERLARVLLQPWSDLQAQPGAERGNRKIPTGRMPRPRDS